MSWVQVEGSSQSGGMWFRAWSGWSLWDSDIWTEFWVNWEKDPSGYLRQEPSSQRKRKCEVRACLVCSIKTRKKHGWRKTDKGKSCRKFSQVQSSSKLPISVEEKSILPVAQAKVLKVIHGTSLFLTFFNQSESDHFSSPSLPSV